MLRRGLDNNDNSVVRLLDDEPDLLALHRQAPERYPFLLQSTASDSAHGRFDILFACPGRVLTSVSAAQRWPRKNYQEGVATLRCKTTLAAQPALAGIKTLNRLEQVLARSEWQDIDVFEGLMCDAGGHLICGTMSNVFVVHGESVSTAALDRCGVAGVMRQHVLDTFRAAGGVITENNINWDDAMSADEIFMTNSQFGVMPIQRCGAQL